MVRLAPAGIVVRFAAMQSGRHVLLEAFDRLFAKAASKLNVSYTPDELADAKLHFERRFAPMLDAVNAVQVEAMPPEVVAEMERAIDELSPTQVVGQLASMPLAHQAQAMLRVIAYRAAEQKLIEHALKNAD